MKLGTLKKELDGTLKDLTDTEERIRLKKEFLLTRIDQK